MSTKPFEPMLYRDLHKVAAKDIIAIAVPLLQEEINYATNAFKRCQDAAVGGIPAEHLAVFSLYHHVIGMIDGVEVLVSQSCAVPTIPLLRSAFEALLGIDYILEKDYQQRAFSWLVSFIHDKKSKYDILNSKRPKGRKIAKSSQEDEIGAYIETPDFPSVSEMIQAYNILLNETKLQSVENEYQRLKRKIHRKPNWFSLFNGPNSIENLAKHFNRGSQYNDLYRRWSSVSHATDLSNYLFESNGRVTRYKPIRNSEELRTFSVLASSFILLATTKMIGKFRSGENNSLGKWYLRECRKLHLALSERVD